MKFRGRIPPEFPDDAVSPASEELRATSCTACGGPLTRDDAFCTRCGEPTPSSSGAVVSFPEIAGPAPDTEPGSIAVAGRRRTRRLVYLTLVFAVTATFAALWLVELARHSHTRSKLGAEISQLEAGKRTIKSELASTRAELADVKALSARRRSVLLKAKAVLRKVEPLLSSVDELQQVTGDIQDVRNQFATSSASLVEDLITLANYLLRSDAYYDTYWVNSMISRVNGELATVRYYASSLTGYDGDYNGASGRFETRANGYSAAVRQLQTQLEAVAK